MKQVFVEKDRSGWVICGVVFMQVVWDRYGQGRVQGILRRDDGALQVIVSHDAKTLPPELLPCPSIWKLVYCDPDEISFVSPVKK